MSEDAVLKLFGEYFFTFCKTSGYDRMLRSLGGNLTEFIENLDALHSYLALSYQVLSFFCECKLKRLHSLAIFLVLCFMEEIPSLPSFYPERLWVEERTFCNAFPFHIVFDEEVRHLPWLERLMYSWESFQAGNMEGNQNVLELLHAFLFKGQMMWMEAIQCVMYLCSPKLRSLEELEEQKMHISDIAQHDATRDLIPLNQQRLAEIELSNQLERKKEELRILSKNLEAERKKTETLLYAMLPKHVANLLKEGKKVEAGTGFSSSLTLFRFNYLLISPHTDSNNSGCIYKEICISYLISPTGEFNSCTILFSDIVTFTNICSACEPIQIVNMLNSMYSKFDRLTSVHNVYKVETIGDAYMVVGGVPVPIASHAKRVANFALGMRTAAREVMNPITGEPIQIRVGIHTGPVLAGVVGEKMPRYCLFGDTVNTASRMESHGLPNKIHLSPTAFRALQNQGFEIVERGEIEVKGKGKMTTYILRQNLYATENEIMGRAEKQNSSHMDQRGELRETS
uniref:guanylate cyclase n=1 Tax=Chelonoidis abingdonii TaxID=106734 RepID=A0A8C0JD53_CHEAB